MAILLQHHFVEAEHREGSDGITERRGLDGYGRETKVGMLTRYNRKTVTVITETGEQWNVAPAFLRRAETIVDTENRSDGSSVAQRKQTR